MCGIMKIWMSFKYAYKCKKPSTRNVRKKVLLGFQHNLAVKKKMEVESADKWQARYDLS